MAYGSQRECEIHLAHRAIYNGQMRLKALSKYIRELTRQRLEAKLSSRRTFLEDQLYRLGCYT